MLDLAHICTLLSNAMSATSLLSSAARSTSHANTACTKQGRAACQVREVVPHPVAMLCPQPLPTSSSSLTSPCVCPSVFNCNLQASALCPPSLPQPSPTHITLEWANLKANLRAQSSVFWAALTPECIQNMNESPHLHDRLIAPHHLLLDCSSSSVAATTFSP